MLSAILLAWLGVSAAASPAAPGGAARLLAYDRDGKLLDKEGFLALIGRADRKPGAEQKPPLLVSAPDGLSGGVDFQLAQEGGMLVLRWERLRKVRLSLPWPVEEDGFSTVWADNGGEGYADGAVIALNQDIALTQRRLFAQSWKKRTTDWEPLYKPGGKAKSQADKSKEAVAEAGAEKDPDKRAAAVDAALKEASLAWQKMLCEHGLQNAEKPKLKDSLRFGLTLDDELPKHLDSYEWVVDMVERSGTNWVRLVFRPNPSDFAFAKRASFNEYDSIVHALRAKGIRIMGCVLDTAQWPRTLTPQAYAARTRNLALHFSREIRSWEVGSELNGDWLGGARQPMGLDQAFRVYAAGAKAVKAVEPSLETVATLYWWDSTAPDYDHSLEGWLKRFVPEGFGKNLDVAAVSLWPEDNPVGMAFERPFELLHDALPDKRVMLGSLGYVERTEVKGYWWLDPSDVDGARKDLVILYTATSCAMPRSLCGGFWWQTLEQMLPPADEKPTDLFNVYKRNLDQLGR